MRALTPVRGGWRKPDARGSRSPGAPRKARPAWSRPAGIRVRSTLTGYGTARLSVRPELPGPGRPPPQQQAPRRAAAHAVAGTPMTATPARCAVAQCGRAPPRALLGRDAGSNPACAARDGRVLKTIRRTVGRARPLVKTNGTYPDRVGLTWTSGMSVGHRSPPVRLARVGQASRWHPSDWVMSGGAGVARGAPRADAGIGSRPLAREFGSVDQWQIAGLQNRSQGFDSSRARVGGGLVGTPCPPPSAPSRKRFDT